MHAQGEGYLTTSTPEVGIYKIDVLLVAGKPAPGKRPHEDLANLRDDENAVKALPRDGVLHLIHSCINSPPVLRDIETRCEELGRVMKKL